MPLQDSNGIICVEGGLVYFTISYHIDQTSILILLLTFNLRYYPIIMSEPPYKRSKPSTNGDAGPSTSNGGENPYLAHLPAHLRGSNGASGSNGTPTGVKNPLAGLVPRQVSVAQAKDIMVRNIPKAGTDK